MYDYYICYIYDVYNNDYVNANDDDTLNFIFI